MASPENDEDAKMDMDGMSMPEMDMPAEDINQMQADAVGAEGRVVSVDMDAKSVTIDHKPVPEIGWPAMVMAFKAPSEIDLMSVKAGEPVRFAFRKTETGYELDMIEPMPEDGEAGDEQ
jgi:Cu/Ag efflux protein CusF